MPAAATLEKWRRGKTSNIPIFLGIFLPRGSFASRWRCRQWCVELNSWRRNPRVLFRGGGDAVPQMNQRLPRITALGTGYRLSPPRLLLHLPGSIPFSWLFTIKVCVSCCWRCPGASAPSTSFLCSSGSNAWGELEAHGGLHVSSKIPSRVQDGDEGFAGKKRKEKYFLTRGHWFVL